MDYNLGKMQVIGLPDMEKAILDELIEIFQMHFNSNYIKDKYYEGDISLDEVNLGIALPDGIKGLEIGCDWGAKTVDVLAARSMFDGFVGINGSEVKDLDLIAYKNNLLSEYNKACRDELKYGCTFATLSADDKIQCKIRFHSPMTAAASWNGEKNRISAGLAIIDTVKANDPLNLENWIPSILNLYTDSAIWVLRRREDSDIWDAEEHKHKMGRPLMEPLIWNATSVKPFGRSRIKKSIRRFIQGYVRTIANATIGLEFSTTPQKYLLGVTDEQFDAVINQKFRQYVGSILAATTNPETGEKPTFGQLTQGSIQPHVEMLRLLATQFSAASGLSVSDTGVVNDANPTSSDAITAQTKTLVGMAEQLNTNNGVALKNIALMATAIINRVSLDDLTDDQMAVVAHFKNPSLPNISETTDAALKIASTRPGFSSTDVFLEMVGFDNADIRRIKAQEQKQRGLNVLEELNGNNTENVEQIYIETPATE